MIGDILLFFHEGIYHADGSQIPKYLNLASGILFGGLIIQANMKHEGFKSQKAKLSMTMTIMIALIACLGFYGNNFIIEFCYSLFPLMVIIENSFIDIIHYNTIINSIFVPLKTLQIFI